MGNRLKDLERPGILSSTSWHPSILIPPNDATWFTSAIVGTVIAGALPYSFAISQECAGGPTVPSLVVTGATFGGGDTIDITIIGKNEFYEEISQRKSFVGNGTTPQVFFFDYLFTTITSVVVNSYTGTPSTETFSIGSGDGATVRMQNPHPRIPFGNIRIFPTLGSALTPTASFQDGKIIRVASTNSTCRPAGLGFTGLDARSLGAY